MVIDFRKLGYEVLIVGVATLGVWALVHRHHIPHPPPRLVPVPSAPVTIAPLDSAPTTPPLRPVTRVPAPVQTQAYPEPPRPEAHQHPVYPRRATRPLRPRKPVDIRSLCDKVPLGARGLPWPTIEAAAQSRGATPAQIAALKSCYWGG